MGQIHLKKYIAAVLTFVLITQTPFQLSANTSSNHRVVPTDFTPTYKPSDSILPDSELTEAEKVVIQELFHLPVKTAVELMFLITALVKKEELLVKQIGEEAVLKRVLTGKENEEVKIEIPGIGKAEYNKIGDAKRGRVFIRIIHYGTEAIYNYYDTNVFNRTYLDLNYIPDTNLPVDEIEARRYLREQFQLYQSRQLMHTPNNKEKYESLETQLRNSQSELEDFTNAILEKAATNAATKNYDKATGNTIRGRNVINIFYNSGKVDSTETLDKTTQLKGFKRVTHYWRAIREKPMLPQDHDLAMLSTVFQSGLTLVVSLGIAAATSGGLDIVPTCLSVIWAGIVGINIRTYQNWTILSKSKFTQYVKGILLSLSFNYTFIFINEGIKALNKMGAAPTGITEYMAVFLGAGLAAISILSLDGLKNHFHSFTNTFINNWAKNKIGEIPRERTRANMNNKEVKFLGKTVNQGYLESQIASGTGSVFKLLDLLRLGKFETPIGEMSWGRIAFIALGIAGAYATTLYTEAHDLKSKLVHRRLWENYNVKITFGTPENSYTIKIPLIGMLFQPAAQVFNGGVRLTKSFMEFTGKEMSLTLKSLFETTEATEKLRAKWAQTAVVSKTPTCQALFK